MHFSQSITEGALFMMSPRKSEETEMSTILKFLPAIVILVTIGVTFGVAQTQINRASTDIIELQSSQNLDHDSLVEIRQDLKYIKEKLDKALPK